MKNKPKYTCTDYRQEMLLISLNKKLHQENLSKKEKNEVIDQIKQVETDMNMR